MAFTSSAFGSDETVANARLISAANPAAISELLDRLEASEKERDALRAAVRHEADCVEAAMAEIKPLRAKIEAMEQQEPVAWLHESRRDSDVVTSAVKHVWGKVAVGSLAAYSIPLYLAPGAQPAPSFADAYQGAREDLAIWKKRALEAEDLNRKFVAEINGPMHMGEPAQPAPSIRPTALSPVINWLRNGCDPVRAADELEMLAAAPEAKP